MSDFMTIDHAIRKYQSYANLNKQLAESQRSKGDINFYKKQKRIQAENLQIVSWLKELKSARKLIASERKYVHNEKSIMQTIIGFIEQWRSGKE